MKNNPILNLLIVLLLIFVSSCATHESENSDFPAVDVPKNKMNMVIQMEDLPQFFNSHKNHDCLDLHVKNLSDKTIVLPSNSQVMLFISVGGSWTSIINTIHDSTEFHNLPPTNTFPGGQVITVCPDIPGKGGTQIVRIILIGHYQNANDKFVGTFLDVTIVP